MTMWFVGFWSGSVEEMWKNWKLQTTEAPECKCTLVEIRKARVQKGMLIVSSGLIMS